MILFFKKKIEIKKSGGLHDPDPRWQLTSYYSRIVFYHNSVFVFMARVV